MKFFETSKYFSLKKSTYINLRWIAIIGQLITVNIIYFVFDFRFSRCVDFDGDGDDDVITYDRVVTF